MLQLVRIPLKKTVEIDLKREFADIIDSTFYQVSSIFNDDLTTVNRMRDIVVASEISEKTLQVLKGYYDTLRSLLVKFPDRQINFTWFETLSHRSISKSSNLFRFELYNIVYNIGALYSHVAPEELSIEKLKTSCKYFQMSAGCFDYILNSLDDDMKDLFEEKALLSLKNLMLAQAQERLWLKSVKDSMKNSIVAKLAMQVSLFYKEAHKMANISRIVRTELVYTMEAKSRYFAAVAYYRNALHFGEKQEFGNEVRSLREAQYNVLKAGSNSDVDSFKKEIADSLRVCERNNDLIYLQAVPENCPVVKSVCMVKEILIDELQDTSSPRCTILFRNLLPVDVIESCTAFNLRQQKYFEDHVRDPLLALNKLLNASIPDNEVPPGMKHISEDDWMAYSDALEESRMSQQSLESIFEQTKQLLQKEVDADNELRTLHGSLRWTIPKVEEMSSRFNEKINKIQEYLIQGKAITEETYEIFNTVDKKLITTELKLPENNDPTSIKVREATKHRYDYIRDAEKNSIDNRVLPKVVSYHKQTLSLDFEALFQEHLVSVFQQNLAYVRAERDRNNELIKELYLRDQSNPLKKLQPRDLLIQDFRHSLQLLEQVKENIEEGRRFYDSLYQTVVALDEEIRQFTSERQAERESLIAKLTT
ncbi:HBL324Wp [Eremothecium sinecaudum]|uniref:HBL324Wp n=1 Tax=Eremothecium sinecaudum TaxID=45286 RepID=A0A109UW41_9SACH|nr:HBL324Wp [Eremothecium sinecaudum]AMD18578.1 HBL324Wp [Eremothecium sinecaudum]